MYAEHDLLPVSALQHLLFCPRQCALIHVEQLWAENALTIQGRHLHQKADHGRGESRRGKPTGDLGGRTGGTDRAGDRGRPGVGGRSGGGVRVARGLMLRSLTLGLYGKADVVEFRPADGPEPGVGGGSGGDGRGGGRDGGLSGAAGAGRRRRGGRVPIDPSPSSSPPLTTTPAATLSPRRQTDPTSADPAAAGGSAQAPADAAVAAGPPAADAGSAEQWLGALDLLADLGGGPSGTAVGSSDGTGTPSGGTGPTSGEAGPVPANRSSPSSRTELLLGRTPAPSPSPAPFSRTDPLIPPPTRGAVAGALAAAGTVTPAGAAAAGWAATVPFPVEYKRGKPKANRCDEVQLCAQALCLEEMLGVPVPAGAIFYGVTRRRVEVPMDAGLRDLTRRLVADLRAMVDEGRTPPAVLEKKCRRCSLLKLCLPEARPGTDAAGRYLRRAVGQSLAAAEGPSGE